jgi:threonine dehydratase
LIASPTAYTFADGVAVCTPVQAALDYFGPRADHFVGVTDDEVADAIRIYWQDTHNLAEGAGAVALAALLQEKDAMRGKKVAVILSGGNCDMGQAAEILGGATPRVTQDMRKAL